MLLLLQAEPTAAIDWTQFGLAGGVIFVVVVFLWFLLKALPTWKDIKNREFDTRTEEAKVNGQISTALLESAHAHSHLGTAIEKMSEVIENVAIKQERTAENLKILQRASNSETNMIGEKVDQLTDRMDSFEEAFKDTEYAQTRPKAVASIRK